MPCGGPRYRVEASITLTMADGAGDTVTLTACFESQDPEAVCRVAQELARQGVDIPAAWWQRAHSDPSA